MWKIFVIVLTMQILTACQMTRSFVATESTLLNFSCDLLKRSQVRPTLQEWNALSPATKRQIKTNPAFQKALQCIKDNSS
jgi:hypothetical protein